MIVTTKKLFEAAYGKYAIGAYNINNLEQCMGLFQGNLEPAVSGADFEIRRHPLSFSCIPPGSPRP